MSIETTSPSGLTPLQQQAIKTYLDRREIRRSLAAWARHCGYEPAAHHKVIIEHLEAVTRGEISRLAIFMPPGTAKSTYCSALFPPWYLAQFERKRLLCFSHNQTLAMRFGRQCRDLIMSNAEVLGYELSTESSAQTDWATSKKDTYFATGIESKFAGFRSDLTLFDDPIGSIEDADSLIMRDKVWDVYDWNVLPRLTPGAPIIVISTRWHEDDLMGRILSRDKNKRWVVLSFPMEAEQNDILGRKPGDRLWPEYITDDMVAEAKVNPRKWNGAYQQRPAPEQGDYFRKEWLLEYEPKNLPNDLTKYCASDHACSTKDIDKNDPSLLLPFGVDKADNIWILPDVFWEVADTGVVVDEMLAMMKRHRPLVWVAESEHITKSIGPFLNQRMREEGIYTYMEELSSGKDKPAKCRSIQGRMRMRKVFFPKFADWWPRAEHELLTFHVGTHDEFPDALGSIGRFLDRLISANSPSKEKVIEPFTGAWLKRHQSIRSLEIANLIDN